MFEKLAAEYEGKVKFAMINVLKFEGNGELAWDLGVTGTLPLIFFCDEDAC